MAGLFHVIKASDLDAERDIFLGVPVEGSSKQSFHRVPVRSSNISLADGRLARVQMLPGESHVVQSTQGLKRLLLKFPRSFAPGVRMYQQDNSGDAGADRQNVTLGFALFDHRAGPTTEEQQVQANIDSLAVFLRRMLFRCDKIRCTLKLGGPRMDQRQQEVAADMLDLWVARPAQTGSDGNSRRYCYTKVVLPSSNAPEVFQTYFLTPEGRRIPFDVVQKFQNYYVEPFVEIEDIFVNKAVRSIQLKLRECVVYPPAERVQSRPSLYMPNVICSSDMPVYDPHGVAAAPPTVTEAAAPAATENTVVVVADPQPAAAAATEDDDDDAKTLPLEDGGEPTATAATEDDGAVATASETTPEAAAEQPVVAAAASNSNNSRRSGAGRRERDAAAATAAAQPASKRAKLEVPTLVDEEEA